ncbi:PD-(D/E)XK nuclease-like domain-containing protein [Clostridium sp. YIM B02569]|uniref:PD-(D/E)XK nuclease-like domain-containing protein n=1 Tax=Clostridium sp. YIM B02569 TaxID=2911967 RepID=UPI001EEF6D70|nr:PD-(D/E)XK nuclease-like domain-containing protein [Clostridium sp. YIM B02569]
MVITKENYYSLEADLSTMSVSQYKLFKQCELMAMAKLKGEYKQSESDAFLLGKYIHSWSEGTLDDFKKENPSLYSTQGKTKGELKSTFKVAETMVKSLEADSNCMKFLQGEKEVIIQGELFGIKWRGMVDVLNLEKGFFTDLKTTQGIHKKYAGLTFIEHYGYVEQMAIYRELIKQQFGKDLIPYIVAIEKNDNPLKAIIKVDERYTTPKLEEIEYNIERIIKVKSGEEKPIACGLCDQCRKTLYVSQIFTIEDL